MAYTYQDFYDRANQAGLYGQFSPEDLQLAQQYPEFGMSILSLKQDWNAAQTPEARLLANHAANELRRSYGGYYANNSGTGYVSSGKSGEELQKIGSYSPFQYGSAPKYNNPYAEQQQALLDRVLNREAFSYNKDTDPNWSAYAKQYRREGDRATQNALAQAAGMTGGNVSSYAATAAAQAGNYYAQQLSDRLPELYDQAYQRYLQDYQMRLSDLDALNNQQQLGYQEYLNNLGQFNTDRALAYDEWVQKYNMDNNYLKLLQQQEETEYQRELERLKMDQAALAAQQKAAGGGGRGGSGGTTKQETQPKIDINKLGKQYDYTSAYNLYGRDIDMDELASLIASARVIREKDPATGRIRFRWVRTEDGGGNKPMPINTMVVS